MYATIGAMQKQKKSTYILDKNIGKLDAFCTRMVLLQESALSIKSKTCTTCMCYTKYMKERLQQRSEERNPAVRCHNLRV